MRIVIAVDGSPQSAAAVRHAVKLAGALREPPDLLLLTVDPPMMPGVERRIGAEAVRHYHAENAEYGLRQARGILRRAGVAFEERMIVGDPAPEIVRACTRPRSDLLVMGSRGRGAVESAFLGSVAIKVLAGSKVPVTIVR